MHGLFHQLLAFALWAPKVLGMRPRARKPHPVAEDETHKLWFWLEDHGDVLFPVIGILVVALIVYGIRRGMTSNVVDLHKRQEQKDAIVRMMRQKLLVSAEVIAHELGIDRFTASALLDELVREGKLVQQQVAGGVANYRLKGL